MSYHQAKFGTTIPVTRTGSVLTGSRDAIFLRNKYQTELDSTYADFVNTLHHVESVNRNKTVSYFHQAQGLKGDIDAHRDERASLYEALNGLLKKETDFESEMWKTTQKGLKVDTLEVKQKFKDSDIDEIRFSSILDYLKNYPALSSKSSFAELLGKIKDKEKEIRAKVESYHKALSDFKHELPYFEKNIQKCVEKLAAYRGILKEGSETISSCRYVRSFWFRLLPEDRKAEILLDTITHKIPQFESTLGLFKKELSKYKGYEFAELSY